jgi:hypothetical protein
MYIIIHYSYLCGPRCQVVLVPFSSGGTAACRDIMIHLMGHVNLTGPKTLSESPYRQRALVLHKVGDACKSRCTNVATAINRNKDSLNIDRRSLGYYIRAWPGSLQVTD